MKPNTLFFQHRPTSPIIHAPLLLIIITMSNPLPPRPIIPPPPIIRDSRVTEKYLKTAILKHI